MGNNLLVLFGDCYIFAAIFVIYFERMPLARAFLNGTFGNALKPLSISLSKGGKSCTDFS